MNRVSFLQFLLLLSLISGSLSSSVNSTHFKVDPSKVKQISWKPRAFVYEGFLTDEECQHLITIAKSELKRSAVADNDSGNSQVSEVRTSSGAFINKAKDAIVERIEEKIAIWTFLPKENGEDIQVLRYEEGQKYEAHYDYFVDKVNIARGGHRYATVLMYLSNVQKGGETVFPNAELSERQRATIQADDELSECGKRGIAVRPKKGDALLFFSLYPTAHPDPMSLHGGCPVIEGEKWSATKWIHVDNFDKILHDGCSDLNQNCQRWASLGECSKNPEYMVGTAELPGYCRRSCNVC
uniref:procollagen-proline 4-dioxygenase n=1 Tax=Opuntia streptacantha TaxID=393608 RepID=A0A7C8ZAP9_OPUST